MKGARIDRSGGTNAISVVSNADRPIVAGGQLLVEVVTPRVDRVFPRDRVAEASVHRETGKAQGNVVVSVEETRADG